jgi:hypothetical protein
MASRETRRRSCPGELGDRRHLPQQAKRIETPAFQRGRRPRQLGGPAELAFDLLDELADLGGGCLRLLLLDPDQRRLVLAIIENDLENAVGQQRDGDDRHEQRDVFGEETAASPGPRWPRRRIRCGRARNGGSLGRIGVKGKGHRAPFLARRRVVVSCRNAAEPVQG